MTIKIRKKLLFDGKPLEAEVYLPQDELLTNEKRAEADNLDRKLRKQVKNINNDYIEKKSHFNTTKEKWYWLGKQLDLLIKQLEFKQTDLNSNIIWPAINQYLHEDLKREDEERSGTSRDHLNKCWLLYSTKNHEWIKTWAGWDALTERGDQLLDERLLLKLSQQFPEDLSSKDYQFIFKEVTKHIPTLKNRKEMFLMSDKDLQDIVLKIRKEFKRVKSKNR